MASEMTAARLAGLLEGLAVYDDIPLSHRKFILEMLISTYKPHTDKDQYAHWVKEWENKLINLK